MAGRGETFSGAHRAALAAAQRRYWASPAGQARRAELTQRMRAGAGAEMARARDADWVDARLIAAAGRHGIDLEPTLLSDYRHARHKGRSPHEAFDFAVRAARIKQIVAVFRPDIKQAAQQVRHG